MDNRRLNNSFRSNQSQGKSFNAQFGHASELAVNMFSKKETPAIHSSAISSATLLEKIPKLETKCEQVRKLLCNGIYTLLVLSLAALYFVVSGVQFWITMYINLILEIDI
jgi:hypothetical protein